MAAVKGFGVFPGVLSEGFRFQPQFIAWFSAFLPWHIEHKRNIESDRIYT